VLSTPIYEQSSTGANFSSIDSIFDAPDMARDILRDEL
jgi:hypothetical protein